MVKVDIQVRSNLWGGALADSTRTAGSAARAVFTALSDEDDDEGELCIVLADDAFVRKLNRDFGGKDQPTNVLAFALDKSQPLAGLLHLGDVVLAFETLEQEAEAARLPFEHHVAHLVVHGTLHLLGYGHATAGEAEQMEGLEAKIL